MNEADRIAAHIAGNRCDYRMDDGEPCNGYYGDDGHCVRCKARRPALVDPEPYEWAGNPFIGAPFSWPDDPEMMTEPGPSANGAGPAAAVAQARATPPPGATWRPVDVAAIIAAGCQAPPPAKWSRTDGIKLLYDGEVHSLYGETESGKSWVALTACAEEIVAGRHALYVDFENSPQRIIGRLLALGCAPDRVTGFFHYIKPEEPFTPAARAALAADLPAVPGVSIIDGVAVACSMHDLDPDKNVDVARFYSRLPNPLAAAGSAVLLLDHVTKAREGRGRYATGAAHKLNGITGACYILEIMKPFGMGIRGSAKLSVAKDRPGEIRQHCVGTVIGIFHLSSERDGSVIAELAPPRGATNDEANDVDEPSWRPTVLMERLSRYIEANPGMSKRAIMSGVKGKTEQKWAALEFLINDEFVTVARTGTGGTAHTSNRLYRQAEAEGQQTLNGHTRATADPEDAP